MPKSTRFAPVLPVCSVPHDGDICRSKTQKEIRLPLKEEPLKVGLPFCSKMLPTFKDVKGLKVSTCQFTANPPTKHGGIPAPKKT